VRDPELGKVIQVQARIFFFFFFFFFSQTRLFGLLGRSKTKHFQLFDAGKHLRKVASENSRFLSKLRREKRRKRKKKVSDVHFSDGTDAREHNVYKSKRFLQSKGKV
jgi:hypothetical protein